MTERRPDIPRPLARAVRIEAGHRCAIPTCRGTSALEIHHIVDYAKVREHEFANLILLCAVCHARATYGEIDRLSMQQYKVNLGVMNHRYGEFERRILERAAADPAFDLVEVPSGMDLQVWYLVRDGHLEEVSHVAAGRMQIFMQGQPQTRFFRFTASGRDLVSKMVHSLPIDTSAENE